MCLSIPAKIISIEGDMAKVSVGGAEYEASIQMVPDAQEGDYILMHTGFAIQIISEEEAEESLKTFEEFKEFNESLDREEEETGNRIT
ncbi:MAG: HypC/HybG/HupF family hydrogenase formation chaperone [Bacteroidales bacterium]|nr:HypC/HybG/HupF family hydrogenase formation chaperone [Bacteroidales bacterium]